MQGTYRSYASAAHYCSFHLCHQLANQSLWIKQLFLVKGFFITLKMTILHLIEWTFPTEQIEIPVVNQTVSTNTSKTQNAPITSVTNRKCNLSQVVGYIYPFCKCHRCCSSAIIVSLLRNQCRIKMPPFFWLIFDNLIIKLNKNKCCIYSFYDFNIKKWRKLFMLWKIKLSHCTRHFNFPLFVRWGTF